MLNLPLLNRKRTNKCINVSANPTNNSGVTKNGDAAATLTQVDDSAALATAGLSAYGPNVYKLDNTLGSVAANAVISGSTVNMNVHTISAWMRGDGGTLDINTGSGILATVPANAAYVRYSATGTPTADTNMRIRAAAGKIIYFLLNQLEEGAMSPVIVVQGAARTVYS